MGKASAPPSSSAPLTTTWTTIDRASEGAPPPGSTSSVNNPYPWAASDVEEDEAPLQPAPVARSRSA
eukprot:4442058-Prorocentrum_lima.AAC.1